MWLYLSLMLLPPAGAAACRLAPLRQTLVYAVIGIALIVIIGPRYHVGCDWNLYLLQFLRASGATLGEALAFNDPGYMVLNWLVAQAGLSIAAVNTLCALVLVTSLLMFCRLLPRPWLGLFISLPILVLIVAFSATRQSVAVAFALFALCAHLRSRRTWRGVALLLVGASFHESALALIPVLLFARLGIPNRAFAALGLIAATGLGLVALALLLPASAAFLADRPPSGGAWLRAAPIVFALAAFPIVWKRADLPARERSLLFWLAAFAIGCLVCGLAAPFLMDRLGFYTVPFQMLVLTRLAVRRLPVPAWLALNAVIVSPFVLLFLGWLLVGTTAACAIPYRTALADPRLLTLDNTRDAFKFNYITDPWGVFRPLVAGASARANEEEANGGERGRVIE